MPAGFADNIDDVNDADSDPINELNTALVLNGTMLELTDAGGILTSDLSSLGIVSPDWNDLTNIPAGFADGNAGTNPGTDFIGTTDNVALEFHVNNQRGLRIEPADDGTYTGNNVIGGYAGNTVATGVVGATVFGGGGSFPNTVTGDFDTVSGGGSNTARHLQHNRRR
ncbi:MAG: hypothetical protein H6672_16655 [Anaerolineaceae bacterium]|nr:hypothetical protein [Anaerolineaceae bacterium]